MNEQGINCIYPCDFIPFTRRPLLLVIDSDVSKAFKALKVLILYRNQAICGAEKGEPVALLLSPSPFSTIPGAGDSSRHPSRSLFTSFLSAPLQAFLLLLGFSSSDIEMDTFNKAEKLLSQSLDQFGSTLATSDTLDAVWAQALSDPFLRRLILRFIFCRAVLTLYAPTFNKKESHPECIPCLPEAVQPSTVLCQMAVLQVASTFGATNRFVLSEGIMLPEGNRI
ncbi:hypothetical protein RJ639_013850 [Escallonia herrerae]|uniref:Protein SCAI n=1 Tax=Escallonia herrerae TaxID=1293975 RepID=A0AA88VP31_9ASTE|nr:hypothetical protein RJ639_013850 [Escallonia herrerae]